MYYADHFYNFLSCRTIIDQNFLENITTSSINIVIPDYFCQTICLTHLYCVNVVKKIIKLFDEEGIHKHCVHSSGYDPMMPSRVYESLEFTNGFINKNENAYMNLTPIKFYEKKCFQIFFS